MDIYPWISISTATLKITFETGHHEAMENEGWRLGARWSMVLKHQYQPARIQQAEPAAASNEIITFPFKFTDHYRSFRALIEKFSLENDPIPIRKTKNSSENTRDNQLIVPRQDAIYGFLADRVALVATVLRPSVAVVCRRLYKMNCG